MIKTVLEEFGVDHLWDLYVENVQDRLGHDIRYSISNDRIKKIDECIKTTSFKKGLTETIEYYENSNMRI